MKREIKLPEQMFKNALRKAEAFKSLVTTIVERTKAFDHYITALEVEYQFYAEVTFQYHNTRFPDEKETETCTFVLHADDTIIGNTEDYKGVLLDLITRHYKDLFKTKDISWRDKIDSIEIDAAEENLFIARLMAWSGDHVGIYHVEQECGEGWIVLPKKPIIKTSTTLRLEH